MRPSVRHFLVTSHDLPYTPRRAVYGDCKATASAPVDETGRSKRVGGQYRPLDTPEGQVPLRGGLGGQGNREREYSYVGGKTPHFLGVNSSFEYSFHF